MIRTFILAAAMCGALTTPTAACTDDMARLAQAMNSVTLNAELKLRVREILIQARERQSFGDFTGCSVTLQNANRMLNLPVEAWNAEPVHTTMRS